MRPGHVDAGLADQAPVRGDAGRLRLRQPVQQQGLALRPQRPFRLLLFVPAFEHHLSGDDAAGRALEPADLAVLHVQRFERFEVLRLGLHHVLVGQAYDEQRVAGADGLDLGDEHVRDHPGHRGGDPEVRPAGPLRDDAGDGDRSVEGREGDLRGPQPDRAAGLFGQPDRIARVAPAVGGVVVFVPRRRGGRGLPERERGRGGLPPAGGQPQADREGDRRRGEEPPGGEVRSSDAHGGAGVREERRSARCGPRGVARIDAANGPKHGKPGPSARPAEPGRGGTAASAARPGRHATAGRPACAGGPRDRRGPSVPRAFPGNRSPRRSPRRHCRTAASGSPGAGTERRPRPGRAANTPPRRSRVRRTGRPPAGGVLPPPVAVMRMPGVVVPGVVVPGVIAGRRRGHVPVPARFARVGVIRTTPQDRVR